MKKIFNLFLVMMLGLCVLTGCGKSEKKENKEETKKKDNTVEITYTLGKGTIKLSVPKAEDGKPKYEFTTEKPEGLTVTKTVYLVTDKAMIGFATSGLSYNTSTKYIEKYGKDKASFEGYLKFIEDKDLFNKSYLPGLEQFELNGRKALRYYNRAGSSNDYTYYGFFYMVGADDIYPGSKFEMVVNYKDEEKPKESKEIDDETLAIIKSLKIEEAK